MRHILESTKPIKKASLQSMQNQVERPDVQRELKRIKHQYAGEIERAASLSDLMKDDLAKKGLTVYSEINEALKATHLHEGYFFVFAHYLKTGKIPEFYNPEVPFLEVAGDGSSTEYELRIFPTTTQDDLAGVAAMVKKIVNPANEKRRALKNMKLSKFCYEQKQQGKKASEIAEIVNDRKKELGLEKMLDAVDIQNLIHSFQEQLMRR
jgi:hypothetical protein